MVILALVSSLSTLVAQKLTDALSAAWTTTTRAARWGVRADRRFCCGFVFWVHQEVMVDKKKFRWVVVSEPASSKRRRRRRRRESFVRFRRSLSRPNCHYFQLHWHAAVSMRRASPVDAFAEGRSRVDGGGRGRKFSELPDLLSKRRERQSEFRCPHHLLLLSPPRHLAALLRLPLDDRPRRTVGRRAARREKAIAKFWISEEGREKKTGAKIWETKA